MQFFCPHDSTPLEPGTQNGCHAHHCPTCGGNMVSMPALRKCDRYASGAVLLWNKARAAQAETTTECPQCEQAMREVRVPEFDEPFLACLPCQSFWLRRGDMTRLEHLSRLHPVVDEQSAAYQYDQPTRELLAKMELQMAAADAEVESRRKRSYRVERPRGWKLIPALLFLPTTDDDMDTDYRSLATWGIALLCVVAFLLTRTDLHGTIASLGYSPAMPLRYGGLTLLTSFFLHGNVFHLLFNLYYLLVFGNGVEEDLGWPRFLLLILLGHIGGLFVFTAFTPAQGNLMVGASAGVSAVFAYYVVRFPQAHFRFCFFPVILMRIYTFRVPGWVFFGFWMVIQAVAVHTEFHTTTTASSLSHLGGALVGLLWVILWKKVQSRAKQAAPA